MRFRLAVTPAIATLALLVPSAHAAAAPQVTDPPGDANLVNTQQMLIHGGQYDGTALPAGNQAYADVLSVRWDTTKTTTRVRGRLVTVVTGIRVTATFAAPPVAPSNTSLVYRMQGTPSVCGAQYFGVVYYTSKNSDKTIPQSAVRDGCTGNTILTEIPLPVISGNTMVWTAPLAKFPKGFKVGTKLTDLRAEVREIQDFQGHCGPYVGCGAAYGIVDQATSTASYTIGQ